MQDDAASLRAECGMDYRNNLVPVLLDVTKTNTIDDVVRVVSAVSPESDRDALPFLDEPICSNL